MSKKTTAEDIAFLIACYMPTITEQTKRDNVKVSIESTKATCRVVLSTGERFEFTVKPVPDAQA